MRISGGVRVKRLLAGTIVGALGCMASAGPTALAMMPIADILKHRETQLELGAFASDVDRRYSFYQAGTVGLFDRIELGYDIDFLGDTRFHVKLQLFETPPDTPGSAVSVGVMGVRGRESEPYAVGRYDLSNFRLHAGVWRTMGATRLAVGADFEVFGEGVASLEFLSGPSSQTWASLYYPIQQVPGLGAFVAVGFSSDRSEGTMHLATLIYNFRL
jgi:hypothetical protein